MNRIILTISMFIVAVCAMSASLTFNGNTRPVFSETPLPSTGLDEIYVLYNLEGVTAQYISASSSSEVRWYKFSNLGGGYAEEIKNVSRQGNAYTLNDIEPDMGYIVEDGTTRFYYWIVDYSKHYLDMEMLSVAQEQECDVVTLDFAGRANAIKYYTINGQAKELDRDITLSYMTLAYNDDSKTYAETEVVKEYSSIGNTLRVESPLCDTQFILAGDKYLNSWGEPVSVSSQNFSAIAISAHTSVTQTLRENDNEKTEDTALGGSAPVEILFEAVCSDAVVYKEWQFATDAQFENIILRMSEEVTSYVFRDYGTTYVRFMASNNSGTCDYFSDTYEVYVGESSLECPNAFSPDATEGINDEWKVSYKSIISFECHIFNRWGIKVAELTEPSQGWDGKYKGKYVPSGVYYYVIKAEGSDGRRYDLKGDINIIKYKNTGVSTSTEI